MLAIVWIGITVFVVLHSFVLFRNSDEQTVVLVRLAWFAGLGLVAAMIAYFGVAGGGAESDG